MAKDNKRGFFRDVQLDENGNVMVYLVNETGQTLKPNGEYQFYRDIELTEEGYLKITIK